MTKRPSMDEHLSRSVHVGPVWRHQPSLRETLAMLVVWSLVMAAVTTANLLPTAPPTVIEWAVQLITALAAYVLAFLLVESIYHRVR